jgi:hypothetical protein
MSIYDNKEAFGLMSEEDQEALRQHYAGGGDVTMYCMDRSWGLWFSSTFASSSIYRAVRPRWEPSPAFWSVLCDDVVAIAMDGNGDWWGYGAIPVFDPKSSDWGGEAPYFVLEGLNLPSNIAPADSLRVRPGYEGGG